ncbi:MAG: ABC transporter substrate-binding protein [Candidatus Gracilibacteria bacterium]|nr:ABC transporter substrate-binding protein [Candidatus Gracilibacteria bacterium]
MKYFLNASSCFSNTNHKTPNMDKEKIFKLKKYLFLLSVIFFVFIGTHLAYLYLYNDAKKIEVEGGTLSEAIVGAFPSLNPLLQYNDYNKYIINTLYRSLLTYDIKDGTIVGDLAKCDISNLSYIECSIKDDSKWSNGEDVTTNDIISTYNILKNTDINPSIAAILKNTKIEEKNGNIVFKSSTKDVKFLNILFQPIVSAKILDSIGNTELFGNFSTENGLYSGEYAVDIKAQDETLGIEKLNLIKNPYYKGEHSYVSKISLKFFKDNLELIKNKDKISSFNDTDNVIGDTVPRLESYKYIIPQYTSIFINKDRITSLDLRNFLLDKIDRENIVKSLGNDKYTNVLNPFLTDYNIDLKPKDQNLVKILEDLGYYKKGALLEKVMNNSNEKLKQDAINTISSKTKYISSTDKKINKYTFTSGSNILLKGNLFGENPDAVYINDFKLNSYKKDDKNFYFRLSTALDYKTLKDGKNIYSVYFEKDGKKNLKETFTVFYYKDSAKITAAKDDLIKTMIALNKTKTTNKASDEKTKKINTLDDKYFYNRDLKRFEINLDYVGLQKENLEISNKIKSNIEGYGIIVNTKEIASIKDLNDNITKGIKNYDMILVGVNLGSFDFNIFDYFHSSQAKAGYNLSSVKRIDLDIALESLSSSIQNEEKMNSLKKQVLSILKQEQVVKTIESPYLHYLVDKNIKGVSSTDKLPDTSYRYLWLQNAYIIENKQINWAGKGFWSFMSYVVEAIKK